MEVWEIEEWVWKEEERVERVAVAEAILENGNRRELPLSHLYPFSVSPSSYPYIHILTNPIIFLKFFFINYIHLLFIINL